MEQFELFRIESPCRGVCQSSAKGFCKGCLRSREERFHWHDLNEVQRRQVIQLCKARWQRLLKARQERLLSDQERDLPYGMEGEEVQDLFTTPLDHPVEPSH